MKLDKRIRYCNSIYAALHTMSIVCPGTDILTNDVVTQYYTTKDNKACVRVNPNKTTPGTMIKNYSRYMEVLNKALEDANIEDYTLNRADLSLNSDNIDDFELFKKLNKLIICCLAECYNFKNCYKSKDLWSDKDLSVAIKSDYYEVENYDKNAESNGTTETKNRLELRSKRISSNKTLKEEFCNNWCDRLDNAIECFESVQNRFNDELVKKYMTDQEKPKKDQIYLTLNQFILIHKDDIFTRRQLVDLYMRLGVQNPENKAKRFKEKHTIEFYSKTDLNAVTKAIKSKIKEYFEK